jgi:putative NADPH-quinone reductase
VDHACGTRRWPGIRNPGAMLTGSEQQRMPKRILIVIGHPDGSPGRFCRALAASYRDGALSAGHSVEHIDVSRFAFALPGRANDLWGGDSPQGLARAAEAIGNAQHLVFIFPLWMGSMPASLKGFLEQVMRSGSALVYAGGQIGLGETLVDARSARLILTTDTPSPLRRFWDFIDSLSGMRCSIRDFAGIGAVRQTLLDMVGDVDHRQRAKWLREIRRLGARAA